MGTVYGYGFKKEALTKRRVNSTLLGEYKYLERKSGLEGAVYIAEEKGRPVGSLAVVYWTPENDLGHRFQENLRNYPEHPQINNPRVMEIGGIVVDPASRGNNIAPGLLGAAITEFNPDIIAGQTKTPEAVVLGRKFSEYQTSYGIFDVTDVKQVGAQAGTSDVPESHLQRITSEQNSVARAFLDTRRRVYHPKYLTFPYQTDLASTVPDLRGHSEDIRTAFMPVTYRQLVEPQHTIEAPIILIRRRLLLPSA